MGNVSLLSCLVEVFHRFAGRFLMLGQIKVASSCDAFQFLLTEGKLKGDVRASAGIVSKLLFGVLLLAKVFLRESDGSKPILANVNPLPVVFRPCVLIGRDEILDFHLFELARTKDKVPRRYFVAKSLADLSYTEGNLDPA